MMKISTPLIFFLIILSVYTAGCVSSSPPTISFGKDVYACNDKIWASHTDAQNANVNLYRNDAYGEPVWSTSGTSGNGLLLIDTDVSGGLYTIEITDRWGTVVAMDTMAVRECYIGYR